MAPTAAHAPVSAAAPRVVLIDVDGTMVGRVGCAACQYDLLRITGASKGKRFAAAKEDLVARLKHGIVRPHLDAFCRHASAAGVELFVYTASDPRWAAFIVPCIEAALGVKFNRPLFTRTHCTTGTGAGGALEYRKSIARVLPQVYSKLRSKHGLRSAADLRDRVVLVDNTPNIVADPAEASRVIICPSYDYNYVFDVLSHLDVSVLHRRIPKISPVLVRYGLLPPGAPPPSYQHLAQAYYERLARAIADSTHGNTAALGSDRFWQSLWAAMSATARRGAGALDDEAVRAIRRAV